MSAKDEMMSIVESTFMNSGAIPEEILVPRALFFRLWADHDLRLLPGSQSRVPIYLFRGIVIKHK